MKFSLPPKIQRQIKARVKSGKYRTPEDVIAAAISTLEQQDSFGDFLPGELDTLLEQGERDIENDNLIDADEAFTELRRISAKKRRIVG